MMEVAFHSSAVLYYLFADVALVKGFLRAFGSNQDEAISRLLNGSATYITMWNLVVHQIYFAMCCLRASNKLMLEAVLFPTSCFVTMIYWWYYWKSPSLILGDTLAEVYPWWMDHIMHSFILPIALFELYLSSSKNKERRTSKLQGLLTYYAFASFYMVVVNVAFHIRGVWPYPFLDATNNGNPYMFFMSIYAFGTLFYFVGQHLSDEVWGHCSKHKD